MAGKAYLGIDAGTSVVKAAIFDENGVLVGYVFADIDPTARDLGVG